MIFRAVGDALAFGLGHAQPLLGGDEVALERLVLLEELAQHALRVEQSAVFGMKPRSSRLVDLGMWWLLHHPEIAMRTYNQAFMPLGLRFQKALQFAPGMIATDEVDEILMLCRRGGAQAC